jgi:anti-sigma factor ChrR (cupin superfamily)
VTNSSSSQDHPQYEAIQDVAAAALDILEEQAKFEQDLSMSTALQAELAEFQAAQYSLAYGVHLEPLPASLKDKLFARLDRATAKPTNLLDLMDWSIENLQKVAMDLSNWEPFPMPIGSEIAVWHTDEASAELAYFLRIKTAGKLPQHWHATGESILVLEGNFIDDNGQVYEVGDRSFAAANTSHQPTTSMGCLILAVTSTNDKILALV